MTLTQDFRRTDAARLAAGLGLIGGFRNAEGDLAVRHSAQVISRLRAKRASVPLAPAWMHPHLRFIARPLPVRGTKA